MRTPWQRQRHLEAIRAAIHRTRPGLTQIEFRLELRVAWIEIRYDSRGFLLWRGSRLGKQLFFCLAEAQNWRCCYCGVRTILRAEGHPQLATLEHIMPKCLGGTDHPDNLAMACAECNNSRGSKLSKRLGSGEARAERHQALRQGIELAVG